MKDLSEGDALPYFVPLPRPADDEFYNEILFPTSPPIERPDPDSDEPLLPPHLDS